MTNEELNTLRGDLAYRYKNFVNNYLKEQQAGYYNRRISLTILILSGYVYLMETWDLTNPYETNLLTPDAMNAMLNHINILLSSYYTYTFDYA